MNYDCRTMGERISHRRQTLHIKQNILAEKLNISNNHLSSIENVEYHQVSIYSSKYVKSLR